MSPLDRGLESRRPRPVFNLLAVIILVLGTVLSCRWDRLTGPRAAAVGAQDRCGRQGLTQPLAESEPCLP